MSKLKRFEAEVAEPVYATLDEKQNEYITETAGFVPLEVKLKRFEEAGIQMQFSSGEFTSTDYRDIYLNPDFEITPEDEFEDIQEKMQRREEFISKLKASKAAAQAADAGEASSTAKAVDNKKETTVDTEEVRYKEE